MLQSLEAVPATRSTESGWDYEIFRYASNAYFASWLGNYDSAESYIKLAKAALEIHKGQSGRQDIWNEQGEASIYKSEGRLAQSRGEYEKAEKIFTKAII